MDDPAYWEDKFLRLKEENNALKEKCNDLDLAIRTRRSSFETTRYGIGSRRVSRENADLITDLFERNELLRRQQKSLKDKHKNAVAAAGKFKQEVQTLRLRTAGISRRPTLSRASSINREVDTEMQQRLLDAERRVDYLKRENDKLRQQDLKRAEVPNSNAVNVERDVERLSYEDQVKQLAETTSKLHSLQSRHDRLVSKSSEQSELQSQALDKLESYKANIRQLELDLREAKRERDDAKAAADGLEDQQIEIAALTEQNQKLEEQITQLCESPFQVSKPRAGCKNRAFEEENERLKSKCQAQEAMILSLTEENKHLASECDALRKAVQKSNENGAKLDLDISATEGKPSVELPGS